MIDAFKPPAVIQTTSRIRRVLGRLFIGLGLIATGCFLYVFPVFNFPEPTGELKVGTQVFHFIDSSREETFGTTATGNREMMVQVWYPAQAGSNRDKLGKVLTDDVAFALDQFELIQSGQIPSRFKGKIDLKHVGVFGHSIGGATAYDASYDPRITAGIDLDGGLYRLRDRESLQKPFLFIHSESEFEQLKRVRDNRVYTDAELDRMGSTREWTDQVTEDKKRELTRMRETVGEGGQVLYIENTEHLNFTDVQFISPLFKILGITGKIAPERASSVINAYMLDFFDLYLKNQGGNLMKGPDSRFPEMKFATPLL